MIRFSLHRRRHRLITGLLLVALVFRVLIPAGFMPAGDGSLSLRICPMAMMADGLPMSLPTPSDGEDHPGGPAHSDHCPYAFAPAAAPVPHFAAVLPELLAATASRPPIVAVRLVRRTARTHQPRAPPVLA